jgi:hypothetical protein
MNELIIVKGNYLFTDSFAISIRVNMDHSSVVRLLLQHKDEDIFIGIVTQQRKTKRKLATVYLLDELQATFLITLMQNSREVIDFKKKLTKAFFKQRKALMMLLTQKQNAEWLAARDNGKVRRLEETDIIKKFVNYAADQGSKSAHQYYTNITKMENKALFFVEQRYPNLRDLMNPKQLNLIEMADRAIGIALEDGMNDKLHYKDIYLKAKEKIEALAKIFPRTPIPEDMILHNTLSL